MQRAERLRDTQGKLNVQTPAGPICVTISIGIARHEPGEAPAHWLERTDRALYSAKHRGRDRVEIAPALPLASMIPPQLPPR